MHIVARAPAGDPSILPPRPAPLCLLSPRAICRRFLWCVRDCVRDGVRCCAPLPPLAFPMDTVALRVSGKTFLQSILCRGGAGLGVRG